MRRILLVVGLTGLLTGHAFAQQAGQISGVVTDSSGAVVPGVTVTAVEVHTGFRRTAVTDGGGGYGFPCGRRSMSWSPKSLDFDPSAARGLSYWRTRA